VTSDEDSGIGRSVDVRPATVAEVDAVVEHWLALVDEQQRHGEVLESDANRRLARRRLAEAITRDEVLVAVSQEETICGFVGYGVERGYFELGRLRGRIRAIHVDPACRNAGIGTRLLDAAETRLHHRGCESILVDVLVANESARALYADRGYSPHRLTLERRVEVETTTNTTAEK
jgi:ribosomal protein S18 acetylase RimI-like enzyme